MRAWFAIAVLLAVLAATVYVGYVGWNLTDVAMPLTAYVAMTLGIVFSLLIGSGLTALMFYSSATAPTSRHRSRLMVHLGRFQRMLRGG